VPHHHFGEENDAGEEDEREQELNGDGLLFNNTVVGESSVWWFSWIMKRYNV
jgi:hypothetical protein